MRARLAALVGAVRRRAREIETWTEWIYPYRSLRLTREGWFFLGVTLAIGLAALNTGHNLFYLVFAMLVSLIVVSGLLSERAVRTLRVERRLPSELFAKSPAPIELRVRNTSHERTSYAVEIRDATGGEPRRRVGFLERLDPQAERTFVSLWTFPRRGRHEFRSVHLVTRFPFGLFEKIRIVRATETCVAFPAIARRPSRRSARGAGNDGFRKSRLGEEIVGLRRKLEDDDPRRIHWRATARTGEWMVTEHAEALDRPLILFFDSRGPAGDAFETAIERAASLLWHASRAGLTARLFTWTTAFPEDDGRRLRAALTFLAEVEPSDATEAPGESVFHAWRREVERFGGGLFITAGKPPELPPGTLLRVA